jgi:hypothetical protein
MCVKMGVGAVTGLQIALQGIHEPAGLSENIV